MKKFTILLCLIGFSALSSAALVTDGLWVHLDADSLNSTLSNGDSVTTWTANTSVGTVSQMVGFGTPTFVTNAINGHSALQFVRQGTTDADKQFLRSAGISGMDYASGVTQFIVATGSGSGLAGGVGTMRAMQFGRGTGAANQQFGFAMNYNLSGARFQGGSYLVDSEPFPFEAGEWIVSGLQIGQSVAYSTTKYYVNGQQYTGTATDGSITWSHNQVLDVGNGFFRKTDGTVGYTDQYGGMVAEILIYNRQLSAAEIQQVNDYLSAKYLVPEPATLLLLGLGTICTLRMRRKA